LGTTNERIFVLLNNGQQPKESTVPAFDRAQIQRALALSDPAISSFLDTQTGNVVELIEGDESPAQVDLGQLVMDGVGERYIYIAGGNPGADSAAVDAWMAAEGIG
jgi:hypothetical protein